MEEGNAIETLVLPEEVIQHIQSFMSGKEAARSAILSKSWYNAWLTRPAIDLDDLDFRNNCDGGQEFVRFARKTMQRYQDLSLKINSFRLSRHCYFVKDISNELISNAMKLGATDVELYMSPYASLYLQEVLQSESLVRLSIIHCEKIVYQYVISCSRLKSLNLKYHGAKSDTMSLLHDIVSCCELLEELSLYDYCFPKLFGLHKLRRLYLDHVRVPALFFTHDFASRFPCLKDLTILNTGEGLRIHITSNSLETICFKPYSEPYEATFNVPNIRKFTYSGTGLSLLSINGGLSERELDIAIDCDRLYNETWFLKLKKLLTNCSLSRIISLYINLNSVRRSRFENEYGFEVGVEPLVVENLRIDAPPKVFYSLLLRLLRICRPKFITQYWLSDEYDGRRRKNVCLDILFKRLMQVRITPNCGIPEHYLLGEFGLEKVKMEVYQEFGTQWRPLPLEKPLNASIGPVGKRKVRFELIWIDFDAYMSQLLVLDKCK